MTGVLIKRENLNRDVHTRRMLHRDEDGDLGEACTDPGTPEIASKQREARQRAWNRFSPTQFPEGTNPSNPLFGLPASRAMRQYISVF